MRDVEPVGANACRSAAQVRRRLLLHPRWCRRGAGAPGSKRPFPPQIRQVWTEEHPSVCLFRAQVSMGTAVVAAST